MRVYAVLTSEINQGHVWLKNGLPARSIIKITVKGTRRHIYCEALQLDDNFLKSYNDNTGTLNITNPGSSIVMSRWYREKLRIETQEEYELDVRRANFLWGRLHANTQHPQVVVRVAVWLGILSLALGIFSVSLGAVGIRHDITNAWRATIAFFAPRVEPIDTPAADLSVDAVLSWRSTYGAMLGKQRAAIMEQLGPPRQDEDGGIGLIEAYPYFTSMSLLSWAASPKTGNRDLSVGLQSDIVEGVKLLAKRNEHLDVEEVLTQPLIFDFGSGVGRDTARGYFTATTKDGRNTLQFIVQGRSLKFYALMLFKK